MMIYQLTTPETCWRRQAMCSGRLASHFTGLPVQRRVVDGEDWPLEKLQLMHEASQLGPFIFLDTDIAFVAPWDPTRALDQAYQGRLGVARARYQSRVEERAEDVGFGESLNPAMFFNSGMVVAGPDHAPIFERATMLMLEHGREFWSDEGPLNIAMQEAGRLIDWLPPEVNIQTTRFIEPDAIAIHYMDGGCRAPLLSRWCIRFGLPSTYRELPHDNT